MAHEIRPAKREDARFLLPLINRASEGLAEHVWAKLAEPGQNAWDCGLARVQSDNAGISFTNAWIAKSGGQPGGCLIAYRIPDVPEDIGEDVSPLFRPLLELENEAFGTGYIYVLSTVSEMRGKGIGSSLLSFSHRYRGPRGMSLIVADNNTRAQSLYERNGFRAVSSRKMVKNGWQSEGNNWILMIEGTEKRRAG